MTGLIPRYRVYVCTQDGPKHWTSDLVKSMYLSEEHAWQDLMLHFSLRKNGEIKEGVYEFTVLKHYIFTVGQDAEPE